MLITIGFAWHIPTGNLNAAQCSQQSGNGLNYVWGIPEGAKEPKCLLALEAPECKRAPSSRVNHMGNTRGNTAPRYNWTVPYFPSGKKQRCVFRIR